MRHIFYLLVIIGLTGPSVSGKLKPKLQTCGYPSLHIDKYQLNRSLTIFRPKIYDGSEAPKGRFTYMIFVFYSQAKDLEIDAAQCSAALITPKWVLLAAHCVSYGDYVKPNPDRFLLIAGKTDLNPYLYDRLNLNFLEPVNEAKLGVQERRAEKIFYNGFYNATTKDKDIALILASKEFIIGKLVSMIPLSRVEMRSRTPCTILGWGLSKEDQSGPEFILRFAENFKAQTNQEGCDCKKPDDGNFICLEQHHQKPTICSGDSGSPLVCGGNVWGIASHLVTPRKELLCGRDVTAFYTDIYSNLKWLDEQMEQDSPGAEAKPNSACALAPLPLPLVSLYIFKYLSEFL